MLYVHVWVGSTQTGHTARLLHLPKFTQPSRERSLSFSTLPGYEWENPRHLSLCDEIQNQLMNKYEPVV